METSNPYSEQVRLLVEILPLLARRTEFALKGGTAINLFIRDMPRLSVDIDLAYVPVQERRKSLAVIDAALIGLAEELERGASGISTRPTFLQESDRRDKLFVRRGQAEIKIEVATVLRGSLLPPETRQVTARVRERFGPAEMRLLRFEEIYAGKICAALDRQHPRDLFDVKLLLENEGIGEGLKDAFLIYLISGSSPISEMLDPSPLDLRRAYAKEFQGMDDRSASLDSLLDARWRLVEEIHRLLTEKDRLFLLRLKEGTPDWSLSPFPLAADLPAVRWKLYNLGKMSLSKRTAAVKKLAMVLEKGPGRIR